MTHALQSYYPQPTAVQGHPDLLAALVPDAALGPDAALVPEGER